jgi:hypothetical protein
MLGAAGTPFGWRAFVGRAIELHPLNSRARQFADLDQMRITDAHFEAEKSPPVTGAHLRAVAGNVCGPTPQAHSCQQTYLICVAQGDWHWVAPLRTSIGRDPPSHIDHSRLVCAPQPFYISRVRAKIGPTCEFRLP